MKNKAIYISICVCVLSLVFMAVALFISQSKTPEFVPPEFDETAVSGVPSENEAMHWEDLTQKGMKYSVFMCRDIFVENENAVCYFTNPAENHVWLKIRLFDKDGKIVGESGLIKPGEYIKSVLLTSSLCDGDAITVKVMGYEPEAYHSAGAVTFNTTVYKSK